jgi:hypothetical protein
MAGLARRALALASIVAAWAGLACGLGEQAPGADGGMTSNYVIQTPATEVAIVPNGSRQLSFVLVDTATDLPVPDRALHFQILDTALARGATLSLNRGLTDGRGSVSLQVIAGLVTRFRVSVSAENAKTIEVMVMVDPRKFGPVDVAPMVVGALTESVASVHIYFSPGTSCATISRSQPPSDTFAMRVAMPGQVERYSAVSIEDGHAIVGHGLDAAGLVIVDGCVDLSGAAILQETPVRVVLPLTAMTISPVGRFRVTSQLQLQGMPTAVTELGDTWGELAACPSDPGQLWLDCTVDALSPETAEDPLDCKPSATDDGAFDGKLKARRGLMMGGSSRCRQAGGATLETQIDAMFAQNTSLRPNLDGITRAAKMLVSLIGVQSYFQVSATSRADRFQLDHQLEALELGEPGARVPVNLWSLGLPLRTARLVPTSTLGNDITFEQHGFTLRLGSAARLALEQGVLAKRGYPGETAAFISAIFASASYLDRGTTYKGCPALAALVCPQVGGSDGCLVTACQTGVAALGRRLTAVFANLNGAGIDLYLEGTAPMIERTGDGKADSFGWLLPSSIPPGVWSGYLRIGDEQHALSGIFTADREP